MTIRVLFLADTHLGFDLPVRPRIRRRRRGHDFFANYHRALAPALAGEVDLVVHGGDVFNRARVPPSLVYQAFEPLIRVADLGIPVVVVPGNHERSRIPHVRFASHPGIRIFDEARTFHLDVRGCRVALAGFPYVKKVREDFTGLVAATGWAPDSADVSLLCVHHCFEGARCGPVDYTFRGAPDVIRGRDIPEGFAAVLTGHIHRHQVLTRDLSGHPLAAPVLYPGSVERTAFAEMEETKGYLMLELDAAAKADVHSPLSGSSRGGTLADWRFVELPARPMVQHEIISADLRPADLEGRVLAAVRAAPNDAVLRLRVRGELPEEVRESLSAGRLRSVAPPEMNVELVVTA